MESAHTLAKLGLALQIGDERDFRDAVIDILANDATICAKVEALHKEAEQKKRKISLAKAQSLTLELEEVEFLLFRLSFRTPRGCDGMFLNLPYTTWLARQFVSLEHSKLNSVNFLLFCAVARVLFWRRVLLRYQDRNHFCSAVTDGPAAVKVAKDGLHFLLDAAKGKLAVALKAFGLPQDTELFSNEGRALPRGQDTRGSRRRPRQQSQDVEEPPQARPEIVRSSAEYESLTVSGQITGYDPYINIWLAPNGRRADVCLDTGCANTTIDMEFLRELNPQDRIHRLPRPALTTGVIPNACRLNEYHATLDIYMDASLPGTGGRVVELHIKHDVMVIEDYGRDMLIGMAIITKHGMSIHPTEDIILVKECRDACVRLRNIVFKDSQVVEDAEAERERVRKLREEAARTRRRLHLPVNDISTPSRVPRTAPRGRVL